MSLTERVMQRKERINGYACSVATLLDTLDDAELAAFQTMMYGKSGLTEPSKSPKVRGWTEQEVFEATHAEGYKVAKNQINEHRGKRCRCYKARP